VVLRTAIEGAERKADEVLGQLFGQQDRYSLALKSSSLVGVYTSSAKVHLPPNDYTYSDTGMFHDDATGAST